MRWKQREGENGWRVAVGEVGGISFGLHDELNPWFYFSAEVSAKRDVQQPPILSARFMKSHFTWQSALKMAEKMIREIGKNERY